MRGGAATASYRRVDRRSTATAPQRGATAMTRKGIILAGGSGTRLHPVTQVVSQAAAAGLRQADDLLPAVDADAGRASATSCVISTPQDTPRFAQLLGDGAQLGPRASTTPCSPRPEGLAQAFIIGREFVGGEPAALVLGDNIFYGHGLPEQLAARRRARPTARRCSPTACDDPERYGVVEFDADGRAIASRRSRRQPKSNYAVTGLYFYDNRVLDIAAALKPSARGELEITDVNRALPRAAARCDVEMHGPRHRLARHRHARVAARGGATTSQTIERRQGLKVACPEEVAYRHGLHRRRGSSSGSAQAMAKSEYGRYLRACCARPAAADEDHADRAARRAS
ncbi:MAG: sugar phosphate nucleotidyltransferase [Chromatiales bacterium]|nr:sugar phosphate nucleotidyltransferase [Chromatiales bacterium]